MLPVSLVPGVILSLPVPVAACADFPYFGVHTQHFTVVVVVERACDQDRKGFARPMLSSSARSPSRPSMTGALDKRNDFDFILTPSSELTIEQQEEYDRVFNSASVTRRWNQKDLDNASLSLRLALTRQLIAELTVYSRLADAFVVSGNSNLGRLALTLAGEEGALGLPGQRIFGGRVRSIDVPFYPTTWRTSIFA
ncbi:hypothetical protein EXIGLDRAFT_771683 [Exidia glandulosa HHB12029]|uniref:Uncharacterized protein n=1 Tax=Exidia glandulosa HHB12029 TaxID=1314781 RepID=A0A165FT75_EXIGL|nr:hypothetical protein EXIGLDRAFT_771683 [Exidia glandulosa HHB12029]